MRRLLLLAASLPAAFALLPAAAFAQPSAELSGRVASCASVVAPAARLECYDAIARSLRKAPENGGIVTSSESSPLTPTNPITWGEIERRFAPTSKPPALPKAEASRGARSETAASQAENPSLPNTPSETPVAFQTASAPAAPVAYRGWLSRSWELDLKDRNDTFTLRPYRDNYVLPFSYNFRPNRAPSSPTHAASRLYGGDVRHAEGRFQLSLKSRIVNDAFGTPLDLWIGYTQQSFWQMYNGKWSSPFRETDFEPELIATVPVRVNVFGLPLRFAGAGIVHQSNGQTDPLSRSWNRVYGMLGFERGHWSVLARGWARLHENRRSDDNPDLTDYMGYGDLTFHYEWGETALQTLVRYNPRTGYGAFDARVTFPIKGFLRGFVSYFDGYGESLLDYNHHNRTIGIGVTFSDWKIR